MPQTPDMSCFAPSGREDALEIARQHALITRRELPAVLDAVPVIAMVLNPSRQIIHGNRKFVEAVGDGDINQILGKRPGEAFDCIHAETAPGGCGTGEFCVHCGAVRSILLGLAGTEAMRECTLNRRRERSVDPLELLVTSSPLDCDGMPCVIFSITDVSHEKRRRALERIFFHDMLNTVGGIQGLMGYLTEEIPERLRADAVLVRQAVEQLVEEISSQKQLLAAETNELESEKVVLFADEILAVVCATFQNMDLAQGRRVIVDDCQAGVPFATDPVLLRRVLGNLVKNALEATPRGGRVALGCQVAREAVTFWVRNEGVLSEKVQARIFNRSFSTKGAGRGLGTYGAKLLTERYLDGDIAFTSTPGEGTVFRVRLPALIREGR